MESKRVRGSLNFGSIDEGAISMNKELVTLVLALMTTAVSAQGTGQSQNQQPANNQSQPGAASQAQPSNAGQSQPASGQSQSGNKEIKNPAEVKEMALAILQENPNHVRARAIVTAFDRAAATNGDTTALKEGCDAAQKGLQGLSSWTKPEGMPDAEYESAKTEMAEIFNGTAGFCALQNKDYATAKTFFQKAAEVDPKNLQDTFQLAVADLESNPIDLNGFWYAAKAINLAGNNAQ